MSEIVGNAHTSENDHGHGLTPAELAEIKARAEAATPGPWDFSAHQPSPITHDWLTFDNEHGIYPPLGESGPVAMCPGAELAAFIAHARADVPRLVAEVERLQALLRKHHDIGAIRRMAAGGEALCTVCPPPDA